MDYTQGDQTLSYFIENSFFFERLTSDQKKKLPYQLRFFDVNEERSRSLRGRWYLH